MDSSWTELALLPLADAPDLGGNGFRISENMIFSRKYQLYFLSEACQRNVLHSIRLIQYYISIPFWQQRRKDIVFFVTLMDSILLD